MIRKLIALPANEAWVIDQLRYFAQNMAQVMATNPTLPLGLLHLLQHTPLEIQDSTALKAAKTEFFTALFKELNVTEAQFQQLQADQTQFIPNLYQLIQTQYGQSTTTAYSVIRDWISDTHQVSLFSHLLGAAGQTLAEAGVSQLDSRGLHLPISASTARWAGRWAGKWVGLGASLWTTGWAGIPLYVTYAAASGLSRKLGVNPLLGGSIGALIGGQALPAAWQWISPQTTTPFTLTDGSTCQVTWSHLNDIFGLGTGSCSRLTTSNIVCQWPVQALKAVTHPHPFLLATKAPVCHLSLPSP